MTLGRSRIKELRFWLTWCMEDKNFRSSQISLFSSLSFVISDGSPSCRWCSFVPLLQEQCESIWVQADKNISVMSADRNSKCCLCQSKVWLKICSVLLVPASCCPENQTDPFHWHAANVQKWPKNWLLSKFSHHQKRTVLLHMERLQVKGWATLSCTLAFAMWSNFLISCSFISNCSEIKSVFKKKKKKALLFSDNYSTIA